MPPCERMLSSAIASSSAVVMPARTEARSSSRVSPTRRPATRIRPICSGVFSSIPRSRKPNERSALRDGGERAEDPVGDLVDVACAVDLDEQLAVAVDLDQRLGLLGVHLLAAPDHLFGVVGATLGLGPLEQPLD